jgi:hypothetical protein
MVVQAVANRCDRCFEDHIRHSLQQLAAVLQQGGVRLALESLDLGLEQAAVLRQRRGIDLPQDAVQQSQHDAVAGLKPPHVVTSLLELETAAPVLRNPPVEDVGDLIEEHPSAASCAQRQGVTRCNNARRSRTHVGYAT